MSTYGAEIEKPISDITTGQPRGLSQRTFARISEIFDKSELDYSDIEPNTVIAVEAPTIGHIGLDNGYNLQETSSKVTKSLGDLENIIQTDLKTIQNVLAEEGATVINLSIHPLGKTDKETHRVFVAPKGVYKYIAKRGWDHAAGIDAKAQNSPSTGVLPENAAKALTTIIGASAAFVGIFANSPFQEGKVSQFKESRLKMWDRFFKNSISEGDRVTAKFPDKPFNTLKDYFGWMYGEGTNIHFVMASGDNYKTFGEAVILIDNNPSVLEYLSMKKANGKFLKSGDKVQIKPNLKHAEVLQFAQFASARIRWHFDHSRVNVDQFLEAYENNRLEELFSKGAVSDIYIEGRDPGANFPDSYLKTLNSDIAWSTVTSPSALQAGIINNLNEAYSYISNFSWKHLDLLRESAIIKGLQGEVDGINVYEFAKKIFEIAGRGLSMPDHRMLAYPEHVLNTKQNGADRALEDFLEKGKSIEDIVKSRNVAT